MSFNLPTMPVVDSMNWSEQSPFILVLTFLKGSLRQWAPFKRWTRVHDFIKIRTTLAKIEAGHFNKRCMHYNDMDFQDYEKDKETKRWKLTTICPRPVPVHIEVLLLVFMTGIVMRIELRTSTSIPTMRMMKLKTSSRSENSSISTLELCNR